MAALFYLTFIIPFLVFWLWMFWEFINNPKISQDVKFYWLLGFVFLGLLTAGYYYFTEYQKK